MRIEGHSMRAKIAEDARIALLKGYSSLAPGLESLGVMGLGWG